MDKTASKSTKNLLTKIVIKVVDDCVVDGRIQIRAADGGWKFVKKNIALKPVLVNEVLGLIKVARTELQNQAVKGGK